VATGGGGDGGRTPAIWGRSSYAGPKKTWEVGGKGIDGEAENAKQQRVGFWKN